MSFWVNRCVFPISGLLRVLLILLSCCLYIRPFRCVFFFYFVIFQYKFVRFLLHPVAGMFSCRFLPDDRIFFRCFEMPYFFCIVLLFVGISLIFRISPVLSLFFLSSYCYLLCCLFLMFLEIPASFFWFIILSCFRRFLSAFPVEFPILVLIFSSCVLRGSQYFTN